MEPREYTNMAQIEDRHFWFIQTRAMVRDALLREGITPQSKLLDIGCGTGGTMHVIHDICSPSGIDMSLQALEYATKKIDAPVAQADATVLPFTENTFDFAIALDVIEHIQNDVQVLREIKRVLKPGGKLVLTVPAHQYLFSTHDKSLHHVRRYSRQLLKSRIEESGLQIQRLTYTNFLLFTPIAAVRLIKKHLLKDNSMPSSDATVPMAPVNAILSGTMAMERAWLHRLNLPYGVSMMAVLRA